LFFAIGIGLFAFPFINPPQNHPLFHGQRIPRHHSRFAVVGDPITNSSSQTFKYDPVQLGISYPYTEISTYPLNTYMDGTPCTNRNNHCQYPYQCIRNRCTPVSEGDYCVDSEECGHWMSCIHGHCKVPHFAGETCHTNSECYSHSCSKGVCVGIKTKGRCDPYAPNQCGSSHYCSLSRRRCRPHLKIDQFGCTDTGDYSNYLSVCGNFGLCNAATNQCMKLLSVDEGEPCGDVLNCKLDLECKNQTCSPQSQVIICDESWCDEKINSTNFTFRDIDHHQDSHPCQEEVDLWLECAESNRCHPRHIYDWSGCMAENCYALQKNIRLCLSHGELSGAGIDDSEMV